MPSAKRERKKSGRLARQQAALAAQRRARLRTRIIAAVLVGGLVVSLAFAFSRGGKTKKAATVTSVECPPADGSAARKTKFTKAPPTCIDAAKSYTVTMKTTKGTITIALDPKKAPKTVNNFVVLARYHYFDGIVFHRIIPGFVVQGGDPEGTGRGGPGYKFADELPQAGQYKIGSLAMANAGPNTNGSQFFIITGQQGVQLPPSYSLFGQVIDGLDVVKQLEAAGLASGTPKASVKMETVTVAES